MKINFSSFRIALYAVLTLAIVLNNAYAGATFSSPVTKATLIELYTSEGCSSCPPADRWLSKLNHHEQLWKILFPVAFHVDYWDYLGWKDKFANQRFSQRQYDYRKAGFVSTVYTPGMMKNGREWRAWRWTNDPVEDNSVLPGNLTIHIEKNILTATFDRKPSDTPYVLNIALLGMNRPSKVGGGENSGKALIHDFVVLDFQQVIQTKNVNQGWQPITLQHPEDTDAVVAWVTMKNNPTPLQVTGGLLR